jgi:quercetin dioxygenase-like cupin family protein
MNRSRPKPYMLPEAEGEATWFAGALMVKKATAGETRDGFDLIDQTVGPGYAPPRHVHAREDEAWYLLEGSARFWCGDQTFDAVRGAFVFLPKGIEHAFLAGPEGARLLTLTIPTGFAAFVDEAGVPAAHLAPPVGGAPDPERLAEIAARHGITITGPPPGPADRPL